MKPKRALGYARVSSIAQTLGSSLEDQQAAIRAHAGRRGIESVTMYVEAESAGHEAVERRHQMQALMREVRAGDLVVCDKLDRWSRDPAFAHTSIRDILKRGASFYAVSDSCDPSTPDGDTMLNVRVMIAREEHKRIKERTVGTRNAMRASGLYTDPVPPRGYRIEARRLVVDEEGAAIVRAVFQESILGRSVTRTAKALGLDRKTVHFILRNRYYLGETRDGRGGWMRGTHEALITPDVWQRARDASESRRLGGVRPRLITSGATSTWILRTVAHCGACGHRMTSAYHVNRDGATSTHYYRCARKCGASYVRVRDIEAVADGMILDRLESLREEIARGPVAPSSGTRALDIVEQRAKLTAKRERLLELYADGMLTREALRERMDRVDADLSRIGESEAPRPMTEKAKRSALRTLEVMRQAWSRAKPAAKREIVEHLAAKVMLVTGGAPVFEWRTARELTDV